VKVNNSLPQQIALIFLFVITIYYPSLFAKFTSIDDVRLINSLLNADDFSLKDLFISNSSGTYYRPLLMLTFIMDKYVWGLEASFMHLENIFLHLGNSLLVFFLARRLLAALSIPFSFSPLVAALLFGLHPIATETVNWVSGRTDLLAGFFVLSALLMFIEGMQTGTVASLVPEMSSKKEKARGLTLRPYIFGLLGAIALLAGCLSKESALFILPLILLWSVAPPKDVRAVAPLPLRRYYLLMYAAAGFCYLFLRWLALSGGDKIVKTVTLVGTDMQKNLSYGFLTVFKVVTSSAGFYFKKLILPLPLNFGINSISPHYFWLGLAVLAGAIWCLYRRDTYSYLLLAAFLLTSSAFILPILKFTWTPYAERYVYIATAPFVVAVTIIYLKYINQSIHLKLTTLLIVVLLGGATVVTARRNMIWQDNFTLYKDTMEKSPGFGIIVNEYALALRDRGQNEEADKLMLTNRVEDFQKSASLNKIRVLTANGRLVEARSLLNQRIDKGTDNNIVMLELLLVIDESRRIKAEQKQEQLVIDLEILGTMKKLLALTGDPFYYYRMGRIQLRFNNRSTAKNSFSKAWQGAPLHSHYREAARKLAESL